MDDRLAEIRNKAVPMPTHWNADGKPLRWFTARDRDWLVEEILRLRQEYRSLRQNIYDTPKYDTQTKALEKAEAEKVSAQMERADLLVEVGRLRDESIRHAECCEKAAMYDRIMGRGND